MNEQFSSGGQIGRTPAQWSLFGTNTPYGSQATLGVNTNLTPNVSVGASTSFSNAGLTPPSVNAAVNIPVNRNSSVSFQGSSGPFGHSGSVNFTHRF